MITSFHNIIFSLPAKFFRCYWEALVAGTRKFGEILKRLVKRRCAIEPIIGHAKRDHALQRNYLHGEGGDRSNALLVACGFNLRKLCRFFLDEQIDVYGL